ncbi:MAG: hypothetical protein MRZ91_04000 [Christensenellaceae bacterium]|nr:hypothetical protein [Christensenellaceae bacterium]
MKNEITIPTSKKRTTAFIIVIAVVLAAFGVLFISLGNMHKFLGNVTELSGTVKEIVYDREENNVYIYTDEYARPFRITSLYTTGSSPVVNGEELKNELVSGSVIIVKALDSELNGNGKNVYIRYLASSGKVYIDEEVAVTLILQNDQIIITVGIIFLSAAFAAVIVGIMIMIFAKPEKKADLFEFFGKHCTGPQPPKTRKNSLIAIFSVIAPMLFVIPLAVFEEAGNQTAAIIFAVIFVVVFLAGAAVAIYFGIVKNRAICREFYKELFAFPEDKITKDRCGLFPDQSSGGAELYRIDDEGISSLDYSAYDRLFVDFKTEKLLVMPADKVGRFNALGGIFDMKVYDENGNEVAIGKEKNELKSESVREEKNSPRIGSAFEEYEDAAKEDGSATDGVDFGGGLNGTSAEAARAALFEKPASGDPIEQERLAKELPIGEIPTISFEEAKLRAISFFKNDFTPMCVVIATDLEEGAHGLKTDLFFILDADLYSVLKNLNVKVRGLSDALEKAEERMKNATSKSKTYYN